MRLTGQAAEQPSMSITAVKVLPWNVASQAASLEKGWRFCLFAFLPV